MKNYVSTRGGQSPLNFYQSIIQGIASDGGLLVPSFKLPRLDLSRLSSLDYIALATEIMSVFVPEESLEELNKACNKAYGDGLFPSNPVPVKDVGTSSVAELFHGQTAAFKDMALSILPHLMTMSLRKEGEKRDVLILAATSGDTGKAALEGFKNVEGTRILVFYPTDGVSAIQKQQMVSQEGDNVGVVGISGNFDDAQRAVKNAFADEKITKEAGIFLSSANSINIGRLIPQIVYYFSSYFSLVNEGKVNLGDAVNFCVPSGNFGDCLAGWLAKQMGLPVNRFLVASNKNNILTDFFTTGVYDTRRTFYKTNAPAMDILVSSNLERLLWFLSGCDGEKIKSYMQELSSEGVYQIDEKLKSRIAEEFSAGYLDEKEVLDTITECYKDHSYLLDTHTACAYGYLKKYQKETRDYTKTIIMSTASPYKFPESVLKAISGEFEDPYTAMEKLQAITKIEIPKPLQGIKDRKVLHTKLISKDDISKYIIKISSFANL